MQVWSDDNSALVSTYTYGDSNERLLTEEGGFRTYYCSDGGAVIAEYTEMGTGTTPTWSTFYIYLGARLLATIDTTGGGEAIRYHHPPQWNPKSHSVFGTAFQDQVKTYTCPNPPDCQDVDSTYWSI